MSVDGHSRTPGIIPAPCQIEPQTGVFKLGPDTLIDVVDQDLSDAASQLARFLRRATGYELGDAANDGPGQNAIRFVLDTQMSNPEQYALHVDEDSVTIRAATSRGAFYATQSLRQLLPPQIESPTVVESVDWSVNAVQIDDMPTYSYRGMHLDVSRHFFPVEFVKCYLDWMALHKLNTFHWHLTDDQGWRIEIKKYPRLTEVGAWRHETVVGHSLSRDASGDGQRHGGFYTQEEIRDVVAHAASRCITVIPEIDMPGHASALLAAYPEFGCRTGAFEVATHFGIFADVLCPSEKTLAMIADVLEEVAELFPGPFIHIGGDEALKNQWQESAECQAIMRKNNLQNEEQLQSYFVRRVDAIVRKLGKQSIGWDDILDGGLDDKITVIAWRGMEKATAAAHAGHDVILSPSVFYFDYFQSRSVDEPLAIHGLSALQDAYTFDMELQELDTGDGNRVLGAQGTLWTEYITTPEKAEYMLLPRMCALAEQTWSPSGTKQWEGFVDRLAGHLERLDVMGINASRSHYAVEFETSIDSDDSLQVNCRSNGRNHRILYTLDGSRPSTGAAVYDSTITLSDSTTLRATAEDPDTGILYGDAFLTFDRHKALGCKVRFEHTPEDWWGGDPERTIVNGLRSVGGFFLHADWAGFNGCDMDAIVDLGEAVEICEVSIGFDVAHHRKLYAPTGLEVRTSLDDKDYATQVCVDESEIDSGSQELRATFEGVAARYVRVICQNTTQVYSHESRDMEPVSIYVDEIAVR